MSTLPDIKVLKLAITLLTGLGTLPLLSQEYEVEKAPFNSGFSEFGSVRYKDGVVYCSNKSMKRLSVDMDSAAFYTDMFYTRFLSNQTWSTPEIFSEELTGYINEGPATFNSTGNIVYYGTSLQGIRPNRKDREAENVMGIQAAEWTNGKWTKVDLFPYNAPKSNYSVLHPALSPNDSTLYFASDMPGGFGGVDLYRCKWENGTWSKPVNLGNKINTKGHDLFPFVSAEGLLYFTTNGYAPKDSPNTDIYFAEVIGDGFSTSHPLPEPLNSVFNDFAYSEYSDHQFGLISSNREEKQDMIFTFRMNNPHFSDCGENQPTIFCYTIEDIRITPIDSLPLIYEWDLGDGTKSRGLTVDHCYERTGTYKVALNIIDTISNATFFAVSEASLVIDEIRQPYIISSDTVLVGQKMNLYADLSGIQDRKNDDNFWIIDNEYFFKGDTLPYSFTEAGMHSVVCGVLGKMVDGQREKFCAFKEILVIPDTLPGFPKADPDPSIPVVRKIKMRNNFDPFITSYEGELAPVYQIVLAQSTTPMKFESLLFEKNRFQIKETINEKGEYVYTIGSSSAIEELFPLFQMLQDSGYAAAKVEVFNEPSLYGIDWSAFRNQGMVKAEEITEEEQSYLERKEEIAQIEEVAQQKKQEAIQASSLAKNKNTEHTTAPESVKNSKSAAVRNPEGIFSSENASSDKGNVSTASASNPDMNQESTTAPIPLSQTPASSVTGVGSNSAHPASPSMSISPEHIASNPSGKSQKNLLSESGIEDTLPIAVSHTWSAGGDLTMDQRDNTSHIGNVADSVIRNEQPNGIEPDVVEMKSGQRVQPVSISGDSIYQVTILSSTERIPMNSPVFSHISGEIVEIAEDSSHYSYAVGISKSEETLAPVISKLRSHGYENAIIRGFTLNDMAGKILHKGTYIPKGNANRLNGEFSRLSDINFEYNSADIDEASTKILDYIAAILMLEEDFELRIQAHTCSIGGPEFNQTLSEERARSVEQYLISKGIESSRLHSRGYGDTMPIADNESETGRRKNRRVEFKILFPNSSE